MKANSFAEASPQVVAVIPARGGSSGIPKKNVRPFCGRPLIEWSILAALQAPSVDRVIVSTDCREIREIALAAGAEVPFDRPPELAMSQTPIEPVLRHVCEWLMTEERAVADPLVLLLPTNPLRTSEQVEACIQVFRTSDADSVLTANKTPAHYSPYWSLVKTPEGVVTYYDGSALNAGPSRRQDLPQQVYTKNDLVFVLKASNLFSGTGSLFGSSARIHEVGVEYDGDINEPSDWGKVEYMFRDLRIHDD